jgi:hypothetical protein
MQILTTVTNLFTLDQALQLAQALLDAVLLQPAPGDNPFAALTDQFMAILDTVKVPAAIIGITVAILGFILIPIVPTLQQQRGYIQMALIGVVAIGFIPQIVTFFAGAATPAAATLLPVAVDAAHLLLRA